LNNSEHINPHKGFDFNMRNTSVVHFAPLFVYNGI